MKRITTLALLAAILLPGRAFAFDIQNPLDQAKLVRGLYQAVAQAKLDEFHNKAWNFEVEVLDMILRSRSNRIGGDDIALAAVKKGLDCITTHLKPGPQIQVVRHARVDLAEKLKGKRTFACNKTFDLDIENKS